MENLFDWPIAGQREGLGAMDNLEYLSGPTISQLRRQIELAALIASIVFMRRSQVQDPNDRFGVERQTSLGPEPAGRCMMDDVSYWREAAGAILC